MVRAKLDDPSAWEAAASFCETVLLQKEAAEREREEDAHPLLSDADGWAEEGVRTSRLFLSP
jgi:hypothetical protein